MMFLWHKKRATQRCPFFQESCPYRYDIIPGITLLMHLQHYREGQ